MKDRFVYCVLRSIEYEGDKLVAVYADKPPADEQAKSYNKAETSPGISYRVEQRLVIANKVLSTKEPQG